MADVKKNQVVVLIEDCCHCHNAKLKFIKEKEEDYMYCQTATSCIQLRSGWGHRPIPDWCPRFSNMDSIVRRYCGKRAKIPGIIS